MTPERGGGGVVSWQGEEESRAARLRFRAISSPASDPCMRPRCHASTRRAERGRSLFEGVLRNYPRRLDLWSVYLDQEVGQGDQPRVR